MKATREDRKGSIEYRQLSSAEIRQENDRIKVIGRAAVYDSETVVWWFRERIDREAFTESIDQGVDVEFLISHDGLPLARTSSDTLNLDNREDGLYIEAELDMADPDVQRIAPKMQRGDLSKMSIGFYVLDDSWSLPDDEGLRTRTVRRAELFDVSIVSNPAYEETSIAIAKRSLAQAETIEAKAQLKAVPENRDKVINSIRNHIEVMRCQLLVKH